MSDVRMLKLHEIMAITALSKSTIYGLIRRREFPAPHKLRGGRIARWRSDEVAAWLDEAAPPAAA